MKLIVEKTEKSEIELHLQIEKRKVKFQYPDFVRRIYDGDVQIEVEFVGDIDENDQKNLRAMLKEIESATVKRQDSKRTRGKSKATK